MRNKLGMYMAMAVAMGGLGLDKPMLGTPSQPKPQPRKLSPEEEVEELERRKNQFLLDLDKHNIERKQTFPKFKEFEVHGLIIIAFNQKNAIRDMNFLMQKNLITIKEDEKI